MGLFDLFKSQPAAPTILGILPDIAKQEIMSGRLPILKTNKVFLKHGECCHYIEKAVYEKKTIRKRYVRKNGGYSMPGPFKGTRIKLGGGQTDVVDKVQYEIFRGILYITNIRIVFVGETSGFDIRIDELVAITPYSNCVEMQLTKDNYKLFVPDGGIAYAALQLITNMGG